MVRGETQTGRESYGDLRAVGDGPWADGMPSRCESQEQTRDGSVGGGDDGEVEASDKEIRATSVGLSSNLPVAWASHDAGAKQC